MGWPRMQSSCQPMYIYRERERERVQELCESRGGRPGLSVPGTLVADD